MASPFESSWVRFCVSGTLITAFLVADRLAHRRGRSAPSPAPPPWLRAGLALSLLGFYALIGPTGGALLQGAGNLVGGAFAGLAILLRLGQSVRYPDLGGRAVFSLALPLAVGVPWGLLVVGLPMIAASLYRCHRAERAVPALAAAPVARYRMLPGIW